MGWALVLAYLPGMRKVLRSLSSTAPSRRAWLGEGISDPLEYIPVSLQPGTLFQSPHYTELLSRLPSLGNSQLEVNLASQNMNPQKDPGSLPHTGGAAR